MTVDEAAAIARAARSPNAGWAEMCAQAATNQDLDLADDAPDLRGRPPHPARLRHLVLPDRVRGALRVGSRALRFGAAALVARFAAEDLRQAVAVRFAGGEPMGPRRRRGLGAKRPLYRVDA